MLAQKLILSYGSKLIIQFVEIAASIVVARVAGPTVLGTVAFGLAFVSVFEFLADLGIGSAHIKLVSEGREIDKCISTFSLLKIAYTILFFFIVLGMFLFQKYIVNVQFESTTHEYVILIYLITITINQLLLIPKLTFVGKTEQAKQDIPDIFGKIFYNIFRVIIVLLGYKAIAIASGNLISIIITIPFILYLFKDYPRDKFNKKLASKYFKISLPLIFIGMSEKTMFYLDKVMLQYFTNSKQVGYYTAGFRIGSFLLMIANSVGMLFFPIFSKSASEGNFQYIKNTIQKYERFCFLFIMPMVIFLSIYSDTIIKVILGNQYLSSIPVMILINLAMFFTILNMPYGNIITGMGFFKLVAILYILDLIFFVGSMFVLSSPKILDLGVTGTATAVFLSNIFIGSLFRFYAKKKCDVLDLKTDIKYIIFGIANFIGFYFFYNRFSIVYGINFKIIFIPIYFSITYFVLFFLGLLNKNDLDNYKKLIKINKIINYIKEEIRDK